MRVRGFTLIELMVVLTVVAVLAALVAPNYIDRVTQAREVTLRHNLVGLRGAIDQFYRDRGRYPDTLAELADRQYIRAVPLDPLTDRSDSWIVIPPKGGAATPGKVFDVRSGAPGLANDGSAYAAW